ncbi:hypothetical protein K2173_003473 [Erythroxylum novogranatense]|uniref:NAC domain-containing protein n=1 Tax=Erythroxylum novogranatense TaxID=1862640 RepID=A0AAV8S8Q8_9ROSI|nr:hypothetical protein K2173_003473 [Erythroxylum novogranatense]
MTQSMSISVNGQSQVPPGFRFHPTEEELLHYYLKKKVSYEKIDLDVIRDVDLNKLEPWDIQERCRIGTTPQNDWYFFSHKDKKYPTGTRTNRATAAGFWKATGRDKVIYSNGKRIGMRKTLVFYKGRAPHGQKSDWIMHEYRLDDNTADTNVSNVMGEATQEEGWVVCRTFKKKNLHKTLDSPLSASSITAETRTSQMFSSFSEGALDQILQHMGRTRKEENEADIINNGRFLRPIDTASSNSYNDRFMKLPSLESPNSTSSQSQSCYQAMITDNEDSITNQVGCTNPNPVYPIDSRPTNWAALDRLVASQLNGQSETSRQLACLNDPAMAYYTLPNHHDVQLPNLRSSFSLPSSRSYHGNQDFNSSDVDLWNFATRSSSPDQICHESNPSI